MNNYLNNYTNQRLKNSKEENSMQGLKIIFEQQNLAKVGSLSFEILNI